MALKSKAKPHIDFSDPFFKLYLSLAIMMSAFGIGIGGYMVLGNGKWSLLDCAYMTVITLTTVGYDEVFEISQYPAARVFTIVLILTGMGTILFFISSLTAFIVEGQLRDILWKRRISKEIGKMENHIIICGLGETGLHVAEEMVATHTPCVMVDTDKERLKAVCDILKAEIPFIVGDASDDNVLMSAGVERAHGVITACTDDKDNLFIIISAKQLNPKLRIVTKAISIRSERKLRRAGANKVVTTNYIGGLRMASEMIRPTVTTFLDRMMRDPEKAMRIDEVSIGKDSPFGGKTLVELDIRRKMDLTVMAIEEKKEKKYLYNPEGGLRLKGGMTLVCLGEEKDIKRLRKMARDTRIGSTY